MVAFSANPWVGYVLPDRAPSAGAGHRPYILTNSLILGLDPDYCYA